MTVVVFSWVSVVAVLYPVDPSMATTSTPFGSAALAGEPVHERFFGSAWHHATSLAAPESVGDHRFQRPQCGSMREFRLGFHHAGDVVLPHPSTVTTPVLGARIR